MTRKPLNSSVPALHPYSQAQVYMLRLKSAIMHWVHTSQWQTRHVAMSKSTCRIGHDDTSRGALNSSEQAYTVAWDNAALWIRRISTYDWLERQLWLAWSTLMYKRVSTCVWASQHLCLRRHFSRVQDHPASWFKQSIVAALIQELPRQICKVYSHQKASISPKTLYT